MQQRIIGNLIGGGIRLIPVQQIIAIQSDLQVQRVFLQDHEFVDIRASLVSLKEKLEEKAPGQFISPGKGVLINTLAVVAIHPESVEVEGGQQFSVAKRRYRKIKDRILKYLDC